MLTLAAGSRLGVYEVLGQIGAGGMGEVYRAKDTKLGREVALKILPASFIKDPERVARFHREAQVLASLNHQHIAQLYGLEETHDTPFLVLELVEGESLDQRIARGPIAIREALGIARQIAEALEAAHDKGIIHRDLKPANVALTKDGQVKVLDFGLAKAVERTNEAIAANSSPTMTSPVMMTGVGTILGTAAYMSPEQARGQAADKRSDVWAFGCVLYEMITARRCFESAGESVADAIAALLTQEPDFTALPSTTSVAVRRLLTRTLQKDPRQRIRDIGDARLDIDDALAGHSADSEPKGVGPRDRRLGVVVGVIAGFVLAAAVMATARIASRRTDRVSNVSEMRLNVLPPPGHRFSVSFAISPDGRRLAFTAADAAGRTSVWERELASDRPRQLPLSAGARFFVWSPDSQALAYASTDDKRIKRYDLSTAAESTICDVPRGGSAGPLTWRAGRIIFAGGPQLLTVPDGGGVPAPIGRKFDGGLMGWPALSPDGRLLAFVVNTEDGSLDGSYLGPSDAPEKAIRLDGPTSALAFLSNDRVLYVNRDRLVAQSIDPSSFRLVGEPRTVVENVFRNALQRRPYFGASSTGLIAYRVGVDEQLTQFAWFDDKGTRLANAGAPHVARSFALSPDGQSLAYQECDPLVQTNCEVRVMNLREDSDRRIGQAMVRGPVMPVWSPDGSSVGFTVPRDRGSVLVKTDLSSNRIEETPYNERVGVSDWPFRDRVLYSTGFNVPGQEQLWLSAGGGNAATAVTRPSGLVRNGRTSPDRKMIAYTSSISGRQADAEVYVTELGRSDAVHLLIGKGFQPVWSRDGHVLYFISSTSASDLDLMQATLLGVSPLRVAPARKMFRLPSTTINIDTAFDVAPDGRFLVNVWPAVEPQPLTILVGNQNVVNGR